MPGEQGRSLAENLMKEVLQDHWLQEEELSHDDRLELWRGASVGDAGEDK